MRHNSRMLFLFKFSWLSNSLDKNNWFALSCATYVENKKTLTKNKEFEKQENFLDFQLWLYIHQLKWQPIYGACFLFHQMILVTHLMPRTSFVLFVRLFLRENWRFLRRFEIFLFNFKAKRNFSRIWNFIKLTNPTRRNFFSSVRMPIAPIGRPCWQVVSS